MNWNKTIDLAIATGRNNESFDNFGNEEKSDECLNLNSPKSFNLKFLQLLFDLLIFSLFSFIRKKTKTNYIIDISINHFISHQTLSSLASIVEWDEFPNIKTMKNLSPRLLILFTSLCFQIFQTKTFINDYDDDYRGETMKVKRVKNLKLNS